MSTKRCRKRGCPGPQGPLGLQGPEGPQGVTGPVAPQTAPGTNVQMEGLVGFFHVGNAGSYPWSAMALFDGDTAIQTTDRIQPNFGSFNTTLNQYGRGRTDDLIASIQGNDFGDNLPYLVEYNRNTGVANFVKLSGIGTNGDATVYWDSNSGSYYACTRGNNGAGNDSIYSIDHLTGIATDITALNGGVNAGNDWTLYDMVIIGNTIFVLHSNAPGAEMYLFDRATGQFTSDVNLEPTYTFLGSQFPWVIESTNQQKKFTMLSYDRSLNRAYIGFHPNGGAYRVLGYVEGASEAALETSLITGTFDIKILPNIPNQVLHGLMWLPSI